MKRLVIIIGLMLVALLLVPVSCASAPSEEAMPAPRPAAIPAAMPEIAPMPPPMIAPPGREEVYKEAGAGALPSTEERMIVRNGDMSLVVEDVVDARDEIAQLAVSLDGRVVSSRIWGEEEEMRGTISIRVPDYKFEQAFSELRDLAVRVDSESTSSQDVTEEYTDLGSRLRNAEATESQYLDLLEKATDVEDILKIYERLSWVRNEIEQIKGRMLNLERISSMSLISVRLELAVTAKPVASAGWSITVEAIGIFGRWLGIIVLWIIILSPVWGTILGITLWRRHKRRKAQS